MKYLRKIFEAIEDDPIYQEILDNFEYITDTLGQPKISSEKWGKSKLKKWVIEWNLGINISMLNDATEMVEKLKKIIEELEDVISAKDRLPDYNFRMSLLDYLTIHINPKEINDDYKFIIGQNHREIRLNMIDIERFFNKNGLQILKSEIDDHYEQNETADVVITLNRIDADIFREFKNKFEEEFRNSDLQKEIGVSIYRAIITIYPMDEKTYIIF